MQVDHPVLLLVAIQSLARLHLRVVELAQQLAQVVQVAQAAAAQVMAPMQAVQYRRLHKVMQVVLESSVLSVIDHQVAAVAPDKLEQLGQVVVQAQAAMV